MNIENDLNIPPDEEAIGKKLSRIATQFLLPVLLPASSAFVGWLAIRKESSKQENIKQDNEDINNLRSKIQSLKEEVHFLETRRESLENYHKQIFHEESKEFDNVSADLEKIETMLHRRQGIYCSRFTSRSYRIDLEENDLKPFAYSRPYDKEFGLYKGVLDILDRDDHCGTVADVKNGHLMWVYMDLWKAHAELGMYKRKVKRMTDVAFK